MQVINHLSKMISSLFPLWILLVSVFAFYQPAFFQGKTSYVPLLLGVVMFMMGLTMTPKDFQLIFTRPKDVLYGVGLRYLIMPLLALGLTKVLDLSPSLAAGLILLGACPSATTSNIMTFISKGDMALSVTVTSINTLLAPFLTPLIFVTLSSGIIPVQADALILDILKVVLIPISLGVTLRRFFPHFISQWLGIVPVISILAVTLVIGIVVAASSSKLLSVATIVFIAIFLFNGLGLLLGYLSASSLKMGKEKSKAIAFEIGIVNSGLGAALAMTHLDPIAALPAVLFSFWAPFSGSFIASYWGRKAS